ncbi:hypothetical protein SPRG_19822 [Saprolegnia parasitica CBS 223.65]|uniref:BZIP domain-containing protein n=1 Tax=Saprolegnia parasitica (strain CBS 223.65) TaxID=695850 RepID=A0A067CIE8_SAPPC|nr:hypothetical protein SPRG_19822 [Saprolegnia parasitica CBS 223.65]KDO30273.1 hypothetical protein SPRG_19822 [Saprolegnia parasitica CBS 223.65]|eukprot:XP_012199072.1 hypothetical protein SPRG_19822 [Saprolegnia parasitica CBS 223.65]
MPPFATAPAQTPWSCMAAPMTAMEEAACDPLDHDDLFAMMDSSFPMLDEAPAKKPEEAAKPAMKGEKRKLQVREASRRCRLKQKEEVSYLRSRVAELEQLVRDQAMVPPPTTDALEVQSLRQQNKELTDALQRSQSQMVLIQALLNKTLVETMQSIVPVTSPPSSPPASSIVSDAQRLRFASVVDCAFATLTHFTLPHAHGGPILSITHSANSWFGEIWSVGSELFVCMTKELPSTSLLRTNMVADRVWERSAAVSFANSAYTLLRQRKLFEVDANTHVYERLESVLEMKLLSQQSVKFRRAVSPTTVLIGTATVQPDETTKYTPGKEQLGLLLHSVPDSPLLASVQLVGTYDVVGVPPAEVHARLSKHVLELAQTLEQQLLL